MEAQNFLQKGISIFPIRHGTKKPLWNWKEYQTRFLTRQEIEKIPPQADLAIVCGKISGNVEVFDFDEKKKKGIYKKWLAELNDTDREYITSLPLVETPSGGYHIRYRSKTIEGNLNMFCRGISEDPADEGRQAAYIETRGEGGYVLTPPSTDYKMLRGDPTDIPEISEELRKRMFTAAEKLNSAPKIELLTRKPSAYPQNTNLLKNELPSFEFEARTGWDDILLPHGWKRYQQNGQIYWTRPGKQKGISATENWNGNGLLHIFSSSTPLPSENHTTNKAGKSYTKFQAYTLLNHGGDFKKAAKELRAKGYGYSKQTLSKKSAAVIPPSTPEDGFVIENGASITPKKIEWLWDGKFAKGKLSLIAGNPGLGKSQITLYMASVVSNGGEWICGGGKLEKPSNVIILSAEDDVSDTIVPRLMANGARLENINFLYMTKRVVEGQEKKSHFDITRDVELLTKKIQAKAFGETSLVVIDPLSAYLGVTDSHNNSEVRMAMSHLAELAKETNIAVVGVTHFNKKSGNDSISKVMGSIGFVAAARAAFVVVKDEEDDGKRLFLPAKNNLAKDTNGLAYYLDEAKVPIGGGEIVLETSVIDWTDEEITMTADEALKGEGAEKRETAKEWLLYHLSGEKDGVSLKDLKRACHKENISQRTLYRAFEELDNVRSDVDPDDKRNRIWKLLDKKELLQ